MPASYHNAHHWLVEPLTEEPSYLERRMFGSLAIYLRGLLVLVLCDKEAPWNGVMVTTDRSHHKSLRDTFPVLESHPILGKWLYVSADSEDFEKCVRRLVQCLLNADPRIGVSPSSPRKKNLRKRKQRAKLTPKLRA